MTRANPSPEFAATFREARGGASGASPAMPPVVPPLGLVGDALREAFAGDLIALRDRMQTAMQQTYDPNDTGPWPELEALFPDFVIVHVDGKHYRHAWADGETAITLGEPVEVREVFVPVQGQAAPPTASATAGGMFMEAKAGGRPGRYLVRVIKAGASGNRNYYPDAVLREALPLFNGVRVFVKSDEAHLAGKGKDVNNLVGRLVEARFVEGRGTDQGEIQAVLEMIEPDGTVAVKIREALDRGMADLFGLSIDAVGTAKQRRRGGKTFREASAITQLKSVDLIVEPGAGGAIVDLIEARSDGTDNQETAIMNREELLAMIEARRPDLLKGKDVDELSDDQVKSLFREAVQEGNDTGGKPAGADAGDGEQIDLREARRQLAADAHLREALAESSLPDAAKKRIRKSFRDSDSFTEAEVDQAIKDEREYLAGFVEGGQISGLGDDGEGRVEAGEQRAEKVQQMLDAFFDPANRSVTSFKECYIEITGDQRVTGQVRHCDQARLREALGAAGGFREALDSTSFANVLGDSIHRSLVAEYNRQDQYTIWRQVANVVPRTDFRTNHVSRYGGYGDLPDVAEKGDYLALGSPTDEEATYALSKRGGTETVTMEMVRNDDVGVIQRIPMKLSRSAKRTLSKFVFDFYKDNPAIYDGVAFFHANHNNLGSTALSSSSFAAGRLAMIQQTEKDSGDPLGIGPSFLMVPPELEETAGDLFRRDTNLDRTFVQSLSPTILPIWYWTDATDWALQADPNDIPTIEVGFLDGNEEPDLFVQDSPTVGSLFNNDQITYKIRHIYNGAVVDFRGGYKAVVAG